MRTITILTIIASIRIGTIFGQCMNQVSNLTGTTNLNGILVSATSSGASDTNTTYCSLTYPYLIGYKYSLGASGNGSYTFNFTPAITGATLNFSGITNRSGSKEEVKLFVNGTHYQILSPGIVNGCDSLAVLTTFGDISGCLGCSVSGWQGTIINGPIYSLTVMDTLISGTPFGSIFSLFICNNVSINLEQNEINGNYQLFPNPCSTQTTLKSDNILHNATLKLDNCFGQTVKQLKNISEQTVTFYRDNLPSGMYFIRLIEDSKVLVTKKILITD